MLYDFFILHIMSSWAQFHLPQAGAGAGFSGPAQQHAVDMLHA